MVALMVLHKQGRLDDRGALGGVGVFGGAFDAFVLAQNRRRYRPTHDLDQTFDRLGLAQRCLDRIDVSNLALEDQVACHLSRRCVDRRLVRKHLPRDLQKLVVVVSGSRGGACTPNQNHPLRQDQTTPS